MYGRTPVYVAVDMNSFAGRSGAGSGNFAGFERETFGQRPESKASAMDVVKRLLAMGVDPNHELTRMRPNGNGRGRFADYMMRGGTGPVMIATLSLDDEALGPLIAHGADVDAPNVFQITPLMAAAGMSGSARGGVGSAIGGPGRRGVEEDVQTRVIRVQNMLIKAGANVNARVTNSRTRTAKLVAYVQGRDHEGETALFAAAEAGWDRVVRNLLDQGADATVRNASGKTALDFAKAPPASPRVGGALPNDPKAAESRAATVAMLEPLTPKGATPKETAAAK
jgi:hypothetical protein